ncbi:MAG: single-stranded DNA-binding protein [Clostridium sp. 26_22]|nr:MAG: single-stranded DNA-binding protein [Clostridium sp. 26_22]
MNKVILMGRLTKDVEIRYTQTNNTAVASFNLAVNRRFVKEGEERQADFFNIVAWGKLGEFCSKYFKKGQQVGIIGRLQTRNWEYEQGQKHYVTEVVAEEAYFADSKKNSEDSNDPFSNNTFGENNGSDFGITSDDDLPF